MTLIQEKAEGGFCGHFGKLRSTFMVSPAFLLNVECHVYDPGSYGWIYRDYVSPGRTDRNFVFVR